jgi:hypothetical protein
MKSARKIQGVLFGGSDGPCVSGPDSDALPSNVSRTRMYCNMCIPNMRLAQAWSRGLAIGEAACRAPIDLTLALQYAASGKSWLGSWSGAPMPADNQPPGAERLRNMFCSSELKGKPKELQHSQAKHPSGRAAWGLPASFIGV